jgi:hypothetical protein
MFHKSSSEGYKKMLDGVELKAPVHGERTMLTTVRAVKGAVVPVHQYPLLSPLYSPCPPSIPPMKWGESGFFPHVMGEVRWGCRGSQKGFPLVKSICSNIDCSEAGQARYLPPRLILINRLRDNAGRRKTTQHDAILQCL